MDFAADTLTKLPNTLQTIGESAFEASEQSGKYYVDKIVIPASVKTIGKYAFRDLIAPKVYFKGTPTSIGAQAFMFNAAYNSSGQRITTDIYVPWAEGEGPSLSVVNSYTTIHYNYVYTDE
jgi:hypothetical protein